jgi:molecular chaperone GrpE
MAQENAASAADTGARSEAAAHDTGTRTEASGPDNGEQQKVADLEARIAELEDRWRRALADLDNLRKRMVRDIDRQRLEESARVAREWLPVLDNLDLALEHAKSDPNAIMAGVQAVRDQAIAVLAALGFPRRDDLGTAFDPTRHEAVGTVSDPHTPAGTVLHVVRPGYGDDERQLRPAAVVVATKGD